MYTTYYFRLCLTRVALILVEIDISSALALAMPPRKPVKKRPSKKYTHVSDLERKYILGMRKEGIAWALIRKISGRGNGAIEAAHSRDPFTPPPGGASIGNNQWKIRVAEGDPAMCRAPLRIPGTHLLHLLGALPLENINGNAKSNLRKRPRRKHVLGNIDWFEFPCEIKR